METILVVDEVHTVRCMIQHMLERTGYTVLLARSGHDALLVSQKYKGDIHMLLTEIFLPDTTGRVVATYLTRARPMITVLFTSSLSPNTLRQKDIWIPKPVFLQKPLAENTLLNKVHEVFLHFA